MVPLVYPGPPITHAYRRRRFFSIDRVVSGEKGGGGGMVGAAEGVGRMQQGMLGVQLDPLLVSDITVTFHQLSS